MKGIGGEYGMWMSVIGVSLKTLTVFELMHYFDIQKGNYSLDCLTRYLNQLKLNIFEVETKQILSRVHFLNIIIFF